jgi:hypothetical protein
MGKKRVTVQQDGLGLPMERASGVWMAPVEAHGWVHAALGMGGAKPSLTRKFDF